DAQECLRLGALDFLPKPIPFDRLRQILEVFEPLALTQTVAVAGRPAERRRAPRVRVQLPVQVSEYGSVDWLTTSVDLSPSGMKVRPLWAAPESAVRLSVTLSDDGERLAIVTGAGTGIGNAVALALLREGYSVVLAGRRKELLEATAREGTSSRSRALVVPTDVSNPASVSALFARAKAEFGRLDLLFNNAGTGAPPLPLEDLTYEQWKTVV